MKTWMNLLPVAVVGFAVLYIIGVARTPSTPPVNELDYYEFGKIPVVDEGRIKPIDTYARVNLMLINGGDTYYVDANKVSHPAIEWLLDVVTSGLGLHNRNGGKSKSEKIPGFRIDDPSLREALGFPEQGGSDYSFEEIESHQKELYAEMDRIEAHEPDQDNKYEQCLRSLMKQIKIYLQFRKIETPHPVFKIDNLEVLTLLGLKNQQGFRYALDEFSPRIGILSQEVERAKQVPENKRTRFDEKVLETASHLERYLYLAHLATNTLLVLPPTEAGKPWQPFEQGIEQIANKQEPPSSTRDFFELLALYSDKDGKHFNEAVGKYLDKTEAVLGTETSSRKLEVEAWFNHASLFYYSGILYIFMGLLACAGVVPSWKSVRWSAFALGVFIFLVHTAGLGTRIWISGRPPVTNLYSASVFIGWGALLLALVLELIFQNGIGNIVAAILGALTMYLAKQLSQTGDTLQMMEAVLDTNLWLATHVVCVTLGYTATYVTGFLGLLYIALGLCTPLLRDPVFRKSLSSALYAVLCFATLLSFVGTVLGGIWADYSWGRFWGWDPKENGALIIVIWNALILHARWAGLVKQRGMAVLALVGNMVTTWSFFGTNQLGVGLHSYGINKQLVNLCDGIWLSHLLLIGIGLIPLRYWWSFHPLRPTRRVLKGENAETI